MSKVAPRSIFFILTHTCGIDILFENLTSETQGWTWETFCTNVLLRVGISRKASGLGASEKTKVRGNYVYSHNLSELEEQRGRVFLNLSYAGRGKSHKQEELLWGAMKKIPKELTTELLHLKLPTISASCGVKRYMHYIRFLLTKTS